LRVVCPFTGIYPQVDAALNTYAPTCERIKVARCDLPADCGIINCNDQRRHCHHRECEDVYFDTVAALWSGGEDFMLIEHDIEIRAGVVEELAACPEPWCLFPFPGPGFSAEGGNLLTISLGCTRFRSELLAAQPDLMGAVDGRCQVHRSGSTRDWHRLDVTMVSVLRERGYPDPHVHTPPVIHHHMYPFEGCACGDPDCRPPAEWHVTRP
jgi:hypothetical protein